MSSIRRNIIIGNSNIEKLYPLYFESVSGTTIISLSMKHNYQTVEVSFDNKNWLNLTTSNSVTINQGDKLYVRGILINDLPNGDIRTIFSMTGGNIILHGDIRYIWNYTNLEDRLKSFCGYQLFYQCSPIIDASDLRLPSQSLSNRAYNSMFRECNRLINPPELPATQLGDSCYCLMFYGCSSLIKAPELPATQLTIESYRYMFSNCISLTHAPNLLAKTLAKQSYQYMFQGCSNLNYIKCLAENKSAQNCLQNWVSGISSTGTFIKSRNINWPTGSSGIPSQWTVIEENNYN